MVSNVANGLETVEPETTASSNRLKQVLDSMRQFTTVSEVLRVLGAAIMVGAMSVFLMQGWQDGNDLNRYFMLLAQTLLLAVGGFGLSHFLKENKGARLFFGLSIISVTANFTILGALIYSIVQFDGLLGQYPGFASWVVNDPSNVFLTILGAAAVLIPVTLLAYSIMARRSAKWLTLTYVAANSCLLIPVRTSVWASLLAVGIVALTLLIIKQHGPKDETLTTFEGRFSKFTLFIPPVILFVRSWYLYHLDALAITALSVAGYLVLRHLVMRLDISSKLRGALDVASLPLIVITAGSFAAGMESLLWDELIIPVFAFACVPMTMDLVRRSEGTGRSHVFGLMGALLVCASLGLNELITSGIATSIISFVGCLGTLFYGYWVKQRWVVYVGAFSTACLAIKNLSDFVLWFDFNNWITLSVIGATAIVFASLLDRHGASIKLRLENLKRRARL